MKVNKVYGLCPSCQELAWHKQADGQNLYKCVKCEMFHGLGEIPRVCGLADMKQMKPDAA